VRAALALLWASALAGCTHSVHQVNVASSDDIPPAAHVRKIEAHAQQDVVLFITDNTDYADEALEELLAKCPRGRVVAIEARSSSSHGFLSFENHMKLTGLCLTDGEEHARGSKRNRARALNRDRL
jgi:hypothetical protein